MINKYIVHVDMDAFFAAVEQRDNPSLKGKPVIIGADPKKGRGRGVVSTASYEARKHGINSGMPISKAYTKCPEGVYLPPDMAKYSKVSRQIYSLFYQFTPSVESVGIDEAFLDISKSFHLFGANPAETCLKLKAKIKEKTNLTASLGLAPLKVAAKIASDLKKPDGFLEVKREQLLDFLWPLSISKLWGVGKKTKETLNGLGVHTIGQLANFDQSVLGEYLGKNGLYLWQLANGFDSREVEPPPEAKSIGSEFTFPEDTADFSLIKVVLSRLSEDVSCRLNKKSLRAQSISLKVRLKNFSTHSRSMRLIRATNSYSTIYRSVEKIFLENKFIGKEVRLVGVKAENFIESKAKDTLFEEFTQKNKEKADKAVEEIRRKFGQEVIRRGRSL